MKKTPLKMTKFNRLHSITTTVLIVIFSIFICSCSNDDDGTPPKVITELSQDIKDLIYFQGDEKAPTVLITIPGGPSTEFATDVVDQFSGFLNPKDILTVTVHQAQTLNPDIVAGNDITLTQASSFNTETIEMLSKVTTYFKDQGRTVYVLGLSFGSFVTQDLIAKKGIDSADKYLIVTGRLDMNDVIWQGAAEGRNGFFENGVTPIVETDPALDIKDRNLNRISAGFSMNRYTQLFNTISDLSNVTYIYGGIDQAVGSLTPSEVQFLESKNTNVIVGPGDHNTTLENFIVQGFKEAFGIEL
ncbi:hypothetical protein [Aquimarina algiphila]|uniref:hypothetical protein n=1 Tax=Aquimarina algiphila TaxID=2047982 RepID=UPI0024919640|nr:hypothetical protein [Aquimarina algiphila]